MNQVETGLPATDTASWDNPNEQLSAIVREHPFASYSEAGATPTRDTLVAWWKTVVARAEQAGYERAVSNEADLWIASENLEAAVAADPARYGGIDAAALNDPEALVNAMPHIDDPEAFVELMVGSTMTEIQADYPSIVDAITLDGKGMATTMKLLMSQ